MSNDLINRVTQQLKQASSDSVTPAGPTEAESRTHSPEQLAAINQAFELFRVNYHNQFLKAFPDLDTLNMAKRLWLKLLGPYGEAVILRACEKAIKDTTFLPTVHTLVECCEAVKTHDLPSSYSAYVEACRAPSPKSEYPWSHLAVYYAGKATGWHLIASEPETVVFPVFERNYELLREKLLNNETLEPPLKALAAQSTPKPLSNDEKKSRIKTIRDLF